MDNHVLSANSALGKFLVHDDRFGSDPGGICHMCPSRVVETGKVHNLRITPGNRYRLGIVGDILGGRQAGSLDV